MRPTLGQVQERASVRSAPDGTMPATIVPATKEIPYDYVATFILEGRRGNRVQDVINISVDGAFVAVAIGYSFVPAPMRDPRNRNDSGGTSQDPWVANGPVTIPENTIATLGIGDMAALLLARMTQPPELMSCLLQRYCGIDFKYSIIDSGSGRELQNQPIHNVAGLGEPTGERPFRPLAKPMLFMPRSTIRIEIEEISEGSLYGYEIVNASGQRTGQRVGAELFIVLHGYKILGYGTGIS